MFTGITQGLFPIVELAHMNDFCSYGVQFHDNAMNGLKVGASVSVEGVCQTVCAITGSIVRFQAIAETLKKTTLNQLYLGQRVTIERSAIFGDEVGGHCLSGHISGMVKIMDRVVSGANLRLTIQCNPEMMPYLFEKGFVGLQGCSLTVNAVDSVHCLFSVDLIPHTLAVTDFGNKTLGDWLNIELDAMTVVIVDTVRRILDNNPR